MSLVDGDDNTSMAKSVGLGIISFTDALTFKSRCSCSARRRFEIFASASAISDEYSCYSFAWREITLGAIDDGLRNAITQLASFHFTSTDYYRESNLNGSESIVGMECWRFWT